MAHASRPYNRVTPLTSVIFLQLEAEHAIPQDQKFYCPYLECSALMIIIDPEPSTETPCIACSRALCYFCRTRAHPGLTCGEVKVSVPLLMMSIPPRS